MARGDWHRSEIDLPEAAQITEVDFPLTLMVSRYYPGSHNYVLGDRMACAEGAECLFMYDRQDARSLYTPEETAHIAQRYAGALGLSGFN